MTDNNNTVSFKEYFDALRAADHDAINLVREWTQERLASHNDILSKWRDGTERDRENFVTKDAFEALKSAFDIYKEITAKALTLAEGKTQGVNMVTGALSFVAGLLIALLGAWAAYRGLT